MVWALPKKRFSSSVSGRVVTLLLTLQCCCYSFGIAKSCPTGVPVGTFKILVLPPKGGPALPLSTVNNIAPGQRLRYEPVKLPEDLKDRARVSVILVPPGDHPDKPLVVLPAQAVKDPAEWVIPTQASAVGVVIGPHGIDTKKVAELVEKHPEIVTKLADYAQQTSRVEALVQTLSDYEDSKPDGKSLQSVLQAFSSQYGLQVPAFDSKAASSQQALTLLHALAPTVSANDSIPSRSDALTKTGTAAGSVAATYFGTPLALAIGGAALVEGLHSSLFPPTDFRSAFAEPEGGNGTNLCTAKALDNKSRARIDYVWMSRIPNMGAPNASLADDVHIPVGASSTVSVSTATISQLASLSRARDWELVSALHTTTVPAKVAVGSSKDVITLDLAQGRVPPGEYQLAAKWDWTSFEVHGNVDVRPVGDMADAKVTPDSQDALVTGAGPVQVQLTGTDFEFVDSLSLRESSKPKKEIALPLTLPKGKEQGEQATMQTTIDTSALAPGSYLLAVKQLNGATQNVSITIHPANPELAQLPLRANVGEPQQEVLLRGRRLERIERIVSPGADWKLAEISEGRGEVAERRATVQLASTAQKGDQLNAEVFVTGLHKPLQLSDVINVVGPRPKILAATKSFASQSGVELHDGEMPAGIATSFALQARNLDSHIGVELGCKNEDSMRRKITLSPGEKSDSQELDFTGPDALFLSIDPGAIGDSGCDLIADIRDPATGSSDPFVLGRVVRLPRITNFVVTDEKAGDSAYGAVLTGEDLQLIEKTGWSAENGDPVQGIPTPVPGNPQQQALKVIVSWPPPSPKAPLYIWLRGETQARKTNSRY